MNSFHKIFFKNSQKMVEIDDESINLVVTSPPYPMIEMWDETFSSMNPKIKSLFDDKQGKAIYKLMHEELNKVWLEVDRVTLDGGIVCINIGDATRKIGDNFQLYPNHSKIIEFFENRDYQVLPPVIWRKQANKPNKFMGSGMLPPNAYVTLEHEYILIFRKKNNRIFENDEKKNRQNSAYFWEERNIWFSDVWEDIKGRSQKLNNDKLRSRNGAYPFELSYRLINMYSVKNDTILDPFFGTGTTITSAIASGRNSIGYEIDSNFKPLVQEKILKSIDSSNELIENRLKNHVTFVIEREKEKGELKHESNIYGFNVVTSQEKNLTLPFIKKVYEKNRNEFVAEYENSFQNEPITKRRGGQSKLL